MAHAFHVGRKRAVSVADVLASDGHIVRFVRDILAAGSPDPIVAAASEQLSAVLVSADKNFKSIGPRIHLGRMRFRRLSRIALTCHAPQAARRVEKAMSLIKAEYKIAHDSQDKRMIITIGNSFMRTER